MSDDFETTLWARVEHVRGPVIEDHAKVLRWLLDNGPVTEEPDAVERVTDGAEARFWVCPEHATPAACTDADCALPESDDTVATYRLRITKVQEVTTVSLDEQ